MRLNLVECSKKSLNRNLSYFWVYIYNGLYINDCIENGGKAIQILNNLLLPIYSNAKDFNQFLNVLALFNIYLYLKRLYFNFRFVLGKDDQFLDFLICIIILIPFDSLCLR